MTKAEIVSSARRLARATVSSISDADALVLVDQGFLQFSKDVNGVEGRDYLTVAATFTPRASMAFHITIVGSTNNDCDTDVQVTAGSDNITGTAMATNLQAAIRAAIGSGTEDLTVAWTNFTFTIDAIDSTSIAVTSPDSELSYFDAVELLFEAAMTGTTSVTSGFPRGCTVNAAMPTNSLKIKRIVYDDRELVQSSDPYEFMYPDSTGDPTAYRIYQGKIQLIPTPTDQKIFYVEHSKLIDTSALTGSDEVTDIEEIWQRYVAYWVASEMLMESFEDNLAINRRSEYESGVRKYLAHIANQNPQFQEFDSHGLWYKVIV